MNTQQVENKKYFHIVYYVSGRKCVQARLLNVDTGYVMMRKIARSMAPGLMAMAVHPLDEKRLIPEMNNLGGDARFIPSHRSL